MEWMLMPLRRYADFNGRSRRKEYWMFTLFVMIAIVVLVLLSVVLGGGMSADGPPVVSVLLFGLFFLAIFIPSLAVQIRRFHDQNKSGWFVLLGLISYMGGIVILVFMCLEGTRVPNRFGADSKAEPPAG